MTPVQADWLSIVFAPIGVIALVTSFFARRSATRRGESMPAWGTAVQGVGMVLVMCVALINMTWGT
ncbi:hypothetical protein SSPO_039260 [Streptomyces antimycoticus]|uniref:HIG1 domain-containing protein n=1 Tax=Streptomyces antimycoticus TaxID=68175 RepID=A0A499UN23_9ACTN|nr:hypothetical protein [Streptomyces antimycoticus]BBJ41208.1 hypothetical protein SSPO_039260 [Streptomyces antimycoticus]